MSAGVVRFAEMDECGDIAWVEFEAFEKVWDGFGGLFDLEIADGDFVLQPWVAVFEVLFGFQVFE